MIALTNSLSLLRTVSTPRTGIFTRKNSNSTAPHFFGCFPISENPNYRAAAYRPLHSPSPSSRSVAAAYCPFSCHSCFSWFWFLPETSRASQTAATAADTTKIPRILALLTIFLVRFSRGNAMSNRRTTRCAANRFHRLTHLLTCLAPQMAAKLIKRPHVSLCFQSPSRASLREVSQPPRLQQLTLRALRKFPFQKREKGSAASPLGSWFFVLGISLPSLPQSAIRKPYLPHPVKCAPQLVKKLST